MALFFHSLPHLSNKLLLADKFNDGESCSLKNLKKKTLFFVFLCCFFFIVVVVVLFFYAFQLPSERKKNMLSRKAVVMNLRTVGWTTYKSGVIAEQLVFRAIKVLLYLWRSAIGIRTPELSKPENKERAVPI